jgi:WD40 repeat protein
MNRWHKYIILSLILFGNTWIIKAQPDHVVFGSSNAVIYDMALLNNEETVIVSTTDEIQLWDIATKTLSNKWNASHIVALDYSNSNNKLAGVSKTGSIFIWSVPDGKQSGEVKLAELLLTSVIWIDSVFLVVGSDGGDLVKVNSISGEIVSRIKNANTITAIAAGYGNAVIVGDSKGTLSTYDATEMKLKSSIKGHKSWVREIRMSANSQYYISISDDGYCKMWKSGTQIRVIRKTSPLNWLLCADYSEISENVLDVAVFGQRNGKITITTQFAEYTMGLNSIPNCIRVMKTKLPNLVVLAGTHGGGLQLLNAVSMKMR